MRERLAAAASSGGLAAERSDAEETRQDGFQLNNDAATTRMIAGTLKSLSSDFAATGRVLFGASRFDAVAKHGRAGFWIT